MEAPPLHSPCSCWQAPVASLSPECGVRAHGLAGGCTRGMHVDVADIPYSTVLLNIVRTASCLVTCIRLVTFQVDLHRELLVRERCGK